jgi:hypothetical protein
VGVKVEKVLDEPDLGLQFTYGEGCLFKAGEMGRLIGNTNKICGYKVFLGGIY